jgi:hypothetical protein
MQERWHYTRNDAPHGPVPFGELQKLAASRQLEPADRVRPEGASDWVAAATVPGIFPVATLIAGLVPVAAYADARVVAPKRFDRLESVRIRARAAWQGLSRRHRAVIGIAGGAGLLHLVLVLALVVIAVGFRGTRGRPATVPVPGQPTTAVSPVTPLAPGQPPGAAAPAAQPALDSRLVGTWVWEARSTITAVGEAFVVVTYRYITIGADGTFTDQTQTAASFETGTGLGDGTKRGRVTQQGGVLRFTFDDGSVWTPTWQLAGAGNLMLNGQLFERR